MKETYNNLQELVHTLSVLLCEKGAAQIQKIYSSRTQVSLVLRFKGETRYLLLGRGGSACGAALVDTNIPSEDRLKDKFLDLLRNWLAGRRIYEVNSFLDESGIQFRYTGEVGDASFYTLWAKSKLHFAIRKAGSENTPAQSFIPWYQSSIQKGVQAFDDDKIINLYRTKIVASEIQYNSLELGEGKTQAERKTNKRRDKFHKRKVEKISEDLNRVNLLIEQQSRVSEIQESELSSETFKFGDYELKLKRGLNFYQKRDYVFQKIKDYKKAQSILNKRLLLAKSELQKNKTQEQRVEKTQRAFMPAWVSLENKKNEIQSEANSVNKYLLSDGSILMHGKDASANEWLRSKWSKKDDYWFHLADTTSAHIYLRPIKMVIDETILSIIGSILLDDGLEKRHQEFQLVYTQAKNIKGIKGKVGAVTMKKTKRITLLYRPDWKEIIANL